MEKSLCTQADVLTDKLKEEAKFALGLRENVLSAKKTLEQFEEDVKMYQWHQAKDKNFREELAEREKKIQDLRAISIYHSYEHLQKILEETLSKVTNYLARKEDVSKCDQVSDYYYTEFTKKWLGCQKIEDVRKILQANVEKAENDYNVQTTKVKNYVKLIQERTSAAYAKKKQEHDELVIAREQLNKQIAAKEEKMACLKILDTDFSVCEN